MLTTLPFNSEFDLDPWVGQRSFTFTFERIDGLTGEHLGFVTPLRNATLSHDSSRTIKRQLNINFGAADAAEMTPLTDRIDVSMIAGDGSVWPLGRYMYTDDTDKITTNGHLDDMILNDEMFLVDQEIVVGIDAATKSIPVVVQEIMMDLGIPQQIEGSSFTSAQSWAAGTMRGQILEALAVSGDYFSPWFDNNKMFRMIRSFNPAKVVPQFDFDAGNQVIRDSVTMTSNLLTAPNRFLVTSNTNTGDGNLPISAVATVPPTAPHSFANRGFYITQSQNIQLNSTAQAQAVADNFANRFTVFETATLSTALDPRHDSYDVIRWQGSLWLELGWNMTLTPGGTMSHVMRKAYSG
jgi:hypothetical protein